MVVALSRHPRDKYYIATKLSNFARETWSREASIAMYRNSFRELQVDYIDYMLLHAVGMGGGMEEFENRYIKNGILDFLVEERKAGRIRNLGFSYHGDIRVFDYLLSRHDEYKWDFVQIQLNYLDWKYAKQINPLNTDAEYLYGELEKRGIPAIIMEPLLGGRLSNVPSSIVAKLKQREPSLLCGALVADKVVGKGAAALMILGGVKALHADVVSTQALLLLRDSGIEVTFGHEVPHIINRKGDGMCPVEALCSNCTTAAECRPLIDEFINKISQQKH